MALFCLVMMGIGFYFQSQGKMGIGILCVAIGGGILSGAYY